MTVGELRGLCRRHFRDAEDILLVEEPGRCFVTVALPSGAISELEELDELRRRRLEREARDLIAAGVWVEVSLRYEGRAP